MTAPVLDASCGGRMFWFDKNDERAVFADKRAERYSVPRSRGGAEQLVVSPSVVADFTAMPFANETFARVAFDPPHYYRRNGKTGWVAKKYGTLPENWREMIAGGFRECFRVLRPDGVLVFKWNEGEIAVADILALTPVKPLFGNRYGKSLKSHWLVFMKPQVAR